MIVEGVRSSKTPRLPASHFGVLVCSLLAKPHHAGKSVAGMARIGRAAAIELIRSRQVADYPKRTVAVIIYMINNEQS